MNESKTPTAEWRLRAVLLLFSLLISCLGAEVALRLLGIGAPIERRDTGGFTFFRHDPQLGWDLVPGAVDRFQTDEFDVEVRIDDQGLRSRSALAAESSDVEPSDVERIVVLGDSFSFGHGVDVENAWPSLVEEGLRADSETEPASIDVVNLSVTGYGTDQQWLRYMQRADELEADTVILGLFVGNIFRNARTVHIGYPKPRFIETQDGLELSGVPVPEVAPSQAGASRLWDVAAKAMRSLREHLGSGESWDVTRGILTQLRDHCRERDIQLWIAVIPKDRAIYADGWRGDLNRRTQERAVDMVRTLGIEVIDLQAPLAQEARNTDERLYFPFDGHWTAAGHRVAADAVAAALTGP